MARLRLGYTKSRKGCLRCKQRRVKCDEERPCRACVRHGVECSLVTSADSRSSDGSQRSRRSQGSATPPLTTRSASPSTSRPLPSRIRPTRPIRPSTWKPPDPQSHLSPPPLTTTEYLPPTNPSDPFPYFAKFVTGQAQDDAASWVLDLELLHHYTTTTSKAIFRSGHSPEDRASIWQVDIPRLAFTHTFLLHQVLAIAAFHLAHLDPSQRHRYQLHASKHQTVAIQGVRAALERISPDNCHAIFAASSLFFVGALAASRPDPSSPPGTGPAIDDLVDIFMLVKGIGGVLDTAAAHLRRGVFANLFAPVPAVEPSPTLDRVTAQLEEFLRRAKGSPSLPSSPASQPPVLPSIRTTMQSQSHQTSAASTPLSLNMMPPPSSDEDDDDSIRPVIESEVASFASSIHRAAAVTPDPEYRVIASYPIVMSDTFIKLLRKRNHVALALLAYYCVVMHASEDGYWFTRGWGVSIMADIERSLGGRGASRWDADLDWARGWMEGRGRERVGGC